MPHGLRQAHEPRIDVREGWGLQLRDDASRELGTDTRSSRDRTLIAGRKGGGIERRENAERDPGPNAPHGLEPPEPLPLGMGR